MKKKSRFLTGLLSAVMALSLFALPAAAAGEDATETPAQKTVSTIDWSKNGSITIYKYLKGDSAGNTGTGETDVVPGDAQPLEGAGFTIYKVMDDKQLKAYYSGEATDGEGKTIATVDIDTYTDTDASTGKVTLKTEYEGKKFGSEVVTKKNGVAQFNDLELGLYVVVETTTPPAVTAPVTPFLVSVPMTAVSTAEKNNQGEKWLYDIKVYPKNTTAKGDVVLKKVGFTGSKTDAEALAGVKFTLQWKNPSGQWENVAKCVDQVTNSEGEITVKDLVKGTYRFIETAGTDSGYIVDKNAEYVFEITENKTVAIPTEATNKNDYKLSDGKLVINNYRPDLDKKVMNREMGAYEDDSDYSVGDIIPYEITVGVPGNITKLTTFVVTDTPTNLHFVNGTGADALVIKCGNETVSEAAYTVIPVTAADDVAAGFKIVFTPKQMEAYAGKDLVISYKAKLLASAKSDLAENVGNPNTAKLEYTNKIGTDGIEESNGKGEISDSATVYTFMINIVKKKDSANGDVMSGVVFDLYKEYNDGEADKLPSGAKAIGDADATELGLTVTKDKHWARLSTETTNSQGIISVEGLSNGNYKLIETKTDKEYNLLQKPVDVSLTIQYETHWIPKETYEDGKLVKKTYESTTFKSAADENATLTANPVTTVVNRKGINLPVTGGFGTLLFSGIGALLVVGGIGVLMSTKKKKKGNA